MNTATLSARQILNRQLLAARRLAARHPGGATGKCGSCGVLHCDAAVVAQAFLDHYAEAPEPIIRTSP